MNLTIKFDNSFVEFTMSWHSTLTKYMSIIFILILCGSFVYYAWRARAAVRDLWKGLEELRQYCYGFKRDFYEEKLHVWSHMATVLDVSQEPYSFHAQHGEDVWLWYYFKGKQNGYFIEMGAHNGCSLSNSYFFAKKLGWKGLLVEAMYPEYLECVNNRPESRVVHAALQGDPDKTEVEFNIFEEGNMRSSLHASDAGRTVMIPCTTLNKLLEQEHLPNIDFVSIDVEGAELEVLAGFDLKKYCPEIVLLEANSQESAAQLDDYMQIHGYLKIYNNGCNRFYKRAI